MEEARGRARRGWGTAVGLLSAVAIFSVLHALPLVAVPLGLLMVAMPGETRARRVSAGAMLLAIVFVLPGDELGGLSRAWGLLSGGAFLALSLAWPRARVFPRSLAALAIALVLGGVWLAASGAWAELNATMREHYAAVASLATADLGKRVPAPAWGGDFQATTLRLAELQWTLFPALLGLQSLAAMGLAAWFMARFQPAAGDFGLRPLREFRFPDPMVWLVIVGLVLVALPGGGMPGRAGANLLFFMAGLYSLRGVAIFRFLAGRAPSLTSIVLGTFAAIFLYPVFITAILLVGLGDTWLDVRKRAALAPRT